MSYTTRLIAGVLLAAVCLAQMTEANLPIARKTAIYTSAAKFLVLGKQAKQGELSKPIIELDTLGDSMDARSIDDLASLCTVEVRGMAEQKDIACLSVVSTVLLRMSSLRLSDGTAQGTIAWGCRPDTIACQFPAYAVNGCEGILPAVCPFNYPDALAHFRAIISAWDMQPIEGGCFGYFYYGARPDIDVPECRIVASNGQWGNWYGE